MRFSFFCDMILIFMEMTLTWHTFGVFVQGQHFYQNILSIFESLFLGLIFYRYLIIRVVQAMAAMDPTNPRAWTMKPSGDKITDILIWSRRTPKPRISRQDTVTRCYWVRAAALAAFHGTKQPLHLQVKRHQQRLRPLLSRPALPSAPSTRMTTTGAQVIMINFGLILI